VTEAPMELAITHPTRSIILMSPAGILMLPAHEGLWDSLAIDVKYIYRQTVFTKSCL